VRSAWPNRLSRVGARRESFPRSGSSRLRSASPRNAPQSWCRGMPGSDTAPLAVRLPRILSVIFFFVKSDQLLDFGNDFGRTDAHLVAPRSTRHSRSSRSPRSPETHGFWRSSRFQRDSLVSSTGGRSRALPTPPQKVGIGSAIRSIYLYRNGSTVRPQ